MTALLPEDTMPGLKLEFPEWMDFSGDRFFDFCAANRDLRIERSADGDIIIMPPTDGEAGRRNSELNRQLGNWALEDKTGLVFDSSTGFDLPNSATRSPDAAWILKSRLGSVARNPKGFMKICPDFVVELRSRSDRMPALKQKMEEYLENGARLGWLIDPVKKLVYVYRPGAAVEERSNPGILEGGSVLPGFTLDLARIWADEI